ncbi:hypothetical protein GLOTRDRAFT_93235 [Gloeophyllum trabeum ATCC 11539]|uniref:Uncharacterized protein n=1 Tax=Gloeophyllum trabeum (strain ATCC 11539 / FP-39264 / Madison 617) TaxID=670483 RepID=S7Q868_GLOTA|nr:uncharacterized protein GLOTRDRAFT_93235 [Gloeophyllum trabeum ATCC 11539]EPQ55638.1 hypothetical protein GLOTRDRAFT_93235 [Gloeophyllum trabeum ATCC 11539]
MSPSKRTLSSATRRADAHSKAKGAAKKAEKGAVAHLPPESPGNTKIGIPASRFIDWGEGLRLDTLADLIMDETIPLSCWLIAELPEERGRKEEKKDKKRKEKKKKGLGSDPSLVSSTSKRSVPSASPAPQKTNTVPFPVSTRAEREADSAGLYSTTSLPIPPNPNADDPRMAAALQRHYDDDSSDDEDDDTKPPLRVPWLTGDDVLRRMRRGDPEDTWERPPGPDDLLEPGEERPALTITAEETMRLGDYWDRKHPPPKPMPHFATVTDFLVWRREENRKEAAAAALAAEEQQTSEGTSGEPSRPVTEHRDPSTVHVRSQLTTDEALRYLDELRPDKPLPPPTNPVASGKLHAQMRDTVERVKATVAAREGEEPPCAIEIRGRSRRKKDIGSGLTSVAPTNLNPIPTPIPEGKGKGKDTIPFPAKPLDRATVRAMPNFFESAPGIYGEWKPARRWSMYG